MVMGVFCTVLFSLAVQCGFIKKLGNAVAFLNAPIRLHHKKHLRIKCWILGGNADSIFSVMKKKGLRDAGQKWVMAKLESIKNMCDTHIKIIYLLYYIPMHPLLLSMYNFLYLASNITSFQSTHFKKK
jgi:hypothetical protein